MIAKRLEIPLAFELCRGAIVMRQVHSRLEYMKLHILSDLHIEFADFEPPTTNADVIVLAGDIGVGTDGLEWAAARLPDVPVIYVPGNHEYYGHDLRLTDELKTDAPDNIRVLHDEQTVVDDVRFIGSVLWTDFELFGEGDKFRSMQRARRGILDFSAIRNDDHTFTPEDSITLHESSKAWLQAELAEPFDGKTVVVTHHLPSLRSVARRYASDLLTPAFASNLEPLIDAGQPALWIHGHTHDSFDYEIDNTRVICNPRGYPEETHTSGFVPDLVVEI